MYESYIKVPTEFGMRKINLIKFNVQTQKHEILKFSTKKEAKEKVKEHEIRLEKVLKVKKNHKEKIEKKAKEEREKKAKEEREKKEKSEKAKVIHSPFNIPKQEKNEK